MGNLRHNKICQRFIPKRLGLSALICAISGNIDFPDLPLRPWRTLRLSAFALQFSVR
jgi:hypothetical protein